MSIFSGLTHAWHSFTHTVNHWVDEGKKMADDAEQAVSHIAQEGADFAKKEYGDAVSGLESGFNKALNGVENFGSDITKDVTHFAEDVAHAVAKAAEDVWNDVKNLWNDLKDAILKKLAREVYGEWESILKPLLTDVESTFKHVEEDIDNFRSGINARDAKKALDAAAVILPAVAPFKAAIQHAIDGGMESITLAVGATASLGISEQAVLGAAFNANAVAYLFEHGSFAGFPGNIVSFYTAVGVAIGADEGVTGDLLVGFVSADPSKVGGPSLNVDLGLDVEVGGSISIGFTATPLPPSFSSITVGLSAGEEVKVDISISNTTVIGMIDPEGRFKNPQNLPTGGNAKGSGNPNLYWSKYSWSEINAVDRGTWGELGWNESLWDGNGSPSSASTHWDNLNGEQQSAAGKLGYEKKTWNAPAGVEAWAADNPNEYWKHYDWADMLRHEALLWGTLGWSQGNWDSNGSSSTSTKDWSDLTLEEKKAAAVLGFNTKRWAMPD